MQFNHPNLPCAGARVPRVPLTNYYGTVSMP